jgi:hypothetical protein
MFWAVMSGIAAIKEKQSNTDNKIEALRSEATTRYEKLEGKVSALENNKAGVSGVEFYQWAIHLQQANPNMKVPEPQINTK